MLVRDGHEHRFARAVLPNRCLDAFAHARRRSKNPPAIRLNRENAWPGLRSFLLSQDSQFVATVTEKVLAYSLGRNLEYYDQPTVRKIVRDAAADQYRWSAVLLGVVKSPAFTMRNRLGTQAAN